MKTGPCRWLAALSGILLTGLVAKADFTGVFAVPGNATVAANSEAGLGNWVLSTAGAAGSVARDPAPGLGDAFSITLTASSPGGQTDFTLPLSGSVAYQVSFGWQTFLDHPGDGVFFLVNGSPTALAVQTTLPPKAWSGTSPELVLNPGDTFGWRIVNSSSGAGQNDAVFSLTAIPVPEPKPWVLGLMGLGLFGLLRQRARLRARQRGAVKADRGRA